MNNIKIPFALEHGTNDIIEATKNDDRKCYCPECKEDLVYVNKEENKQTPHFRHYPESKCTSNTETLVHLLAKKILNKANQIRIPAVTTNCINKDSREKIRIGIRNYFSENNFESEFYSLLNKELLLQNEKLIKIEKVSIEQYFKTSADDVKIDVVIESSGKKLFIEPFFSSKIDDDKRKKLALLGITTISIDLLSFIKTKGFLYSIKQLENYLIEDVNGKSWELITELELNQLVNKFIESEIFQNEISSLKIKINQNKETRILIDEIQNKLTQNQEHLNKYKRIELELFSQLEILKDKINQF